MSGLTMHVVSQDPETMLSSSNCKHCTLPCRGSTDNMWVILVHCTCVYAQYREYIMYCMYVHSTENTSCTVGMCTVGDVMSSYNHIPTQSQSYTVPCGPVKCARASQTVYHECCNRTMLISCSNIASFPDPFMYRDITSSIAQYTLKVFHIRVGLFPGSS